MSISRSCVVMAFALAACGGGGGNGGAGPTGPPNQPPPGGGGPPSTATVQMQTSDDGYGTAVNSFSPRNTPLARNGSVTWTNNSGVLHNVAFEAVQGAPANVPDMATGSASRTFGTAGNFNYQCTNHPEMSGQVAVQ